MELFRRTRGSVTIFLVIILVPVLVVTSLFVDMSRIRLARSMAASSADLTLNTVMTQYDKELNDCFGLMASAQSIGEFKDASEKYFEACMISAGADKTFAADIASQLVAMINGEDTINDLMAIDLDNTTVTIEPVEDGSLANPALIKQQMVEFMKYRAPIEGVTSFIGQLASIGDQIDVKPVESMETAVKTEYYEAENKLLEKAYNVYKEILKYNSMDVTDAYMQDMKAYMDTLSGKYEKISDKLVKNWYNSDECQNNKVTSVKDALDSYDFSYSYSDVSIGTVEKKFKDFEKTQKPLQDAIDVLNGRIEACVPPEYISSPTDTSKYDIQYWVKWYNVLAQDNAYENLLDALEKYCKAYADMKQAYEAREDHETWEQTGTTLFGLPIYEWVYCCDYSDESYNGTTYGEYYSSLSSGYSGMISSLNNSALGKISNEMSRISGIEANMKAIDHAEAAGELAEISAKLTEYDNKLNEAIGQLETISEMVSSRKGKGDDVKTLVKEYQEKFENWDACCKDKKVTDNVDKSSLLENDCAEAASVAESRNKPDSDALSVTIDNLEQFVTRTENMINALKNYKEALHSYMYFGTEVISIDTYDKLKNLPGLEESRITVDNSTLCAYAEEVISRYDSWSEPESSLRPDIVSGVSDSVDNSPEYDKPNETHVRFWSWMKGKFKDMEEEKSKTAKDQFKKLKELGDAENKESEKEAEGKDISTNEINSLQNLPSENKQSDSGLESSDKKSSTAMSNVVAKIFGEFNFSDLTSFADSMRDNLYCAMYIMDMFSYDTYNLEGKYDIVVDKGDDKGKYDVKSEYVVDGKTELSNINYKDIYNQDKVKTAWSNTSTTFTGNKSLTNKLLAKDKQYSFGNEVEYILYGGKNKDNKNKMYTSIYAMRYAFDLTATYKTYYNHELVCSISSAISGATCGIIPEILVRIVIVLGINAAEAATDLMYLKAGLPVKLLKLDEKDMFLVFSFDASNDKRSASSTGQKVTSDGIYWSYSDYLFMFVFLGLMGTSKADVMYKRVADVVQSDMGQYLGGQDKFSLAKSYVYYEIKANVKVKPLMMATPISRAYGSSTLDTTKWNMFTYEAIRGY